MNANAFWHLTWKEYRANRAFWLALLVLVVAIESLTAYFFRTMPDFKYLVFSWALAAPAFFAVGSAGMAFAAEREEGTIDFLRAIPASARQVLASKVAVTALATAVLYLALWPMALYFTGGELPLAGDLHALVRMWLIAALEAIAWGTLFSLVCRRPLLAITAAIFAVAICANLLSPSARMPAPYSANGSFTILRIALALVVLAFDAYVGVGWLHRDRGQVTAGQTDIANVRQWLHRRSPVEDWGNRRIVVELSANRDRGAMFGHLFWQLWRQSARSIFVLASLASLTALILRWELGIQQARTEILVVLAIGVAAIFGAFVFRGDQERRQYRFFVEHNIPPRYVWLTRQLLWIAALAATELLVCGILIGPVQLFSAMSQLGGPRFWWPNRVADAARQIDAVTAAMFIAFVPMCYATGQWASMFIRSAVLSVTASFMLGLAACFWAWLMGLIGMNVFLSILPIPVVLLAATWLRAPDWVFESRRWSARLRATAALLVPAVVVLGGIAIYRVRQIPLVSAGLDVASARAEFSSGESATNLFESAVVNNRLAYGESDKQFVAANRAVLQQLLAASRLPRPMFRSQRDGIELIPANVLDINNLVVASGRELERDGSLDEAFGRFMAALRIGCQSGLPGQGFYDGNVNAWNALSRSIFNEFVVWAAQKGQTPARIRDGISRLQKISQKNLWLKQQMEWWYVFAENRIKSDAGLLLPWSRQDQEKESEQESFCMRIFPWEKNRSLRMLNLLTATAIDRLEFLQTAMVEGRAANTYINSEYWGSQGNDNFTVEASDAPSAARFSANEKSDLLATTLPTDLGEIGFFGRQVARQAVRFEAARRAAMICMALRAYRQEHGSLPESLDQLKGAYFGEVPLDPYSALPFRYFPKGMPSWDAPDVDDQARYVEAISPGTPGIWSTGSNLSASALMVNGKEEITYTYRHLPIYSGTTWQHGLWFPIPEQKK